VNAARPRWGAFAAVAGAVLACDQISKFFAVKYLTRAFAISGADGFLPEIKAFLTQRDLTAVALGPATVVPAFWSHRYTENPGAAWSFAAGWPDAVRLPFFDVVIAAALGLIVFYFSRLAPTQRLLGTALSLVMGGALGNLTDRLVHGYVVDFVDWHLADPDWSRPAAHWPTFNVADAGVTVGILLIALDSLLAWRAQRRTQHAPPPAPRDTEHARRAPE
jgi:signal peptidase II